MNAHDVSIRKHISRTFPDFRETFMQQCSLNSPTTTTASSSPGTPCSKRPRTAHGLWPASRRSRSEGYDISKPKTHILYLDTNNFYGWAINHPLPMGGFMWIEGKAELQTLSCVITDHPADRPEGFTCKSVWWRLQPPTLLLCPESILFVASSHINHSEYLLRLLPPDHAGETESRLGRLRWYWQQSPFLWSSCYPHKSFWGRATGDRAHFETRNAPSVASARARCFATIATSIFHLLPSEAVKNFLASSHWW